MLQTDWNKNSTKKRFATVPLKTTISVDIPEEVLLKIKYLCRLIAADEWSGILLYQIQGSMKTPKNCKMILKDIIPMDKGTKAYTEYTFNQKYGDVVDDKMIDYFNINPKALDEDWKIGHIHSHNSMNVYFSGTDEEELTENANSHNFYLSLIVNNYMDFTAKVATKITAETELKVDYKALDEDGKEYIMLSDKVRIEDSKIAIYDCNITHPNLDVEVLDSTFISSAADILKEKKIEEPKIRRKFTKFPSEFSKSVKKKRRFPRRYPNPIEEENLFDEFEENWGWTGNAYGYNPVSDIDIEDAIEEEEILKMNFLSFLVLGYEEDDIEDVKAALLSINQHESPVTTRMGVIDRFPGAFETYFPDGQDREFIDVMKSSIKILEDYADMNTAHILPVIDTLVVLLDKFIRYGAKTV